MRSPVFFAPPSGESCHVLSLQSGHFEREANSGRATRPAAALLHGAGATCSGINVLTVLPLGVDNICIRALMEHDQSPKDNFPSTGQLFFHQSISSNCLGFTFFSCGLGRGLPFHSTQTSTADPKNCTPPAQRHAVCLRLRPPGTGKTSFLVQFVAALLSAPRRRQGENAVPAGACGRCAVRGRGAEALGRRV